MQSMRMHITCVTTTGGYLKLYGQQNVEAVNIIQKNIDCMVKAPMIQTSIPTMDSIEIGNFCLAFKENRFVRARIVSKFSNAGRVNVHYMDFGYDTVVDINSIRASKFPKELEFAQVQATPFILCGIKNTWEPYQLKEITEELLNQDVKFTVEEKIGEDIFIEIMWKNKPLNRYILENKGYGELVTIDYIKKEFEKQKYRNSITYPKVYIKNIRSPRQPYNRQYEGIRPTLTGVNTIRSIVRGIQTENYKYRYTGPPISLPFVNLTPPEFHYQKIDIPTFKTNTLRVGQTYEVVVSDIQNGPCSFSIQLNAVQNNLYQMMSTITNYPLIRLSENAKIGMACIARCPKIGLQYFRAVIISVNLATCKVLFVDIGNSENIQFSDLFEIPIPLLDIKCFSYRFALSGYKDLEPVNESLKELFKKCVMKKILKLKVTPLGGPPLVQYCELFDENGNIFNTLKEFQNRKIVYPKTEVLKQDDVVTVCYIETPKSFYVQKKSTKEKFEKLMDELFVYCNKNRCKLKKMNKGTPCAVKYENAWYRAEIIRVDDNENIYVRQIDYGVERHTTIALLNYIDERFTEFPPQAINCCLKGFEDNITSISDSVINQFEMLAEESDGSRRKFKAKIFKMLTSHCYLLNLIDETLQPELNLMKRLFKLNLPFNKYIGMEKELNATSTPNSTSNEINPSNLPSQNHQSGNKQTHQNAFNYNTPKKPPQLSVPDLHIEGPVLIPTNYNQNWEKSSSNSSNSVRNSSRGGFRRGQRRNTSLQKDTSSSSGRESSNSSNTRPSRGGSRGGKNLPPRFQNQRNNERRQFSGNNQQSDSDWSTRLPTLNNFKSNKIESSDSEFESSTEEFMPFDIQLKTIEIEVPSTKEVVICWWISPHQFFTHDSKMTVRFEKMMRKMQTFYKNKSPVKDKQLDTGSIVVARYKQDNVLYRAKIIASNEQIKKYKVEFIDFGNRSTVDYDDIWQIEKRFTEVPIMTNLCSFENLVSNYDNQTIIDFIAKYLKQGITLTCNYTKKDNNAYIVSIKLKEDSLRDILINGNMVSELKEGIKLHLLIGQRIKAKIISFNDLLNFRILIEGCDIYLMCSYNNIKLIKSKPELSSKFKTKYDGKYCFFDILNVTQDKILIVDPIDPLLTNEPLPAICSYPIITDKYTVKISHVQAPNKYYAQFFENHEIISKLLNDMNQYYSEKGESLKPIKKGMLCAANSNDGNWYRAHILSIKKKSNVGVGNDSIVEVFYIDYGNYETLIENNTNIKLKNLDEKFLVSSAMAIEIFLPFKSISTGSTETVIEEIKNLVYGYQLDLKILENYLDCWITDILSGDYSLLNALEEKKLIEKKYDFEYIKSFIANDIQQTEEDEVIEILDDDDVVEIVNEKEQIILPKTEKTRTNKIKEAKEEEKQATVEMNEEIAPERPMQTTVEPCIKLPNTFPAYITHYENPGKFYLLLESDYYELKKMQSNLQIVAEQLPILKTMSKGDHCVARYTVDGVWYRAKIFDTELLAVQFIDYGNIDVVEVSDIKQMVEPFTEIKTFAISCSLAVAPKNSSDWPEQANAIFNENRDNKLFFNYILQQEKRNYINLFIDNKNVADTLVEKKLVKKLEYVNSGETCFISHINSLSDFYVQMEAFSDGLEAIASYLTGYADFPIIPRKSDASIEGTICAAIFPDDNEWYRAKILSENENGFEVFFIDFGNTATIPEARLISDEIANAPYLSKKCSLRMPSDILEWSQKAEEKFVELAAGGETIFTIELKKPAEAAIVDLLTDGTNLLDILQPLCEENVGVSKIRQSLDNHDILNNSFMNMSTYSDSGALGHDELESVVISHVNSPIDFYVQLNSQIEDLEMVSYKLFDLEEELKDPEIGQLCAALYPKDENYYRAKILSKETDGYNVLYIDFGNCSITNSFKILTDELKNITNLAKHVSLAGVGFDFSANNVIEKFNEILEPFFTENLDMIILDKKIEPWVIKLNLNGEDICDKLKIELGLSLMNKSDIFSIPEIDKKYKNVIISNFVNASEFYVQLEQEVDQVEDITAKLANWKEMEAVTEFPEIGNIYAALFPEDNCFYRGKVLSVDKKNVKVFFVDFGNDTTTTVLRHLPEELKPIKSIANKCCLLMEPPIDESVRAKFNETFVKYMDLHFAEIFQMEIVNPSDGGAWDVKLFNKGANVGEEILQMITSTSTETNGTIDVNSYKKCTVSHFNNPNDFYVQFAENDNKLTEIAVKLLNADTFTKINNIKIGDICAAKFKCDGAYYRAKVLLLGAENNAKVIYIDFGNEVLTDELRELPNDLKQIEPLAKRCALENLSDIDFWSKDAQECFSELINEHLNETFQVNIIKDYPNNSLNSLELFSNNMDPAIVRLEYQDSNISDELINAIKDANMKKKFSTTSTHNWDESNTEDGEEELHQNVENDAIADDDDICYSECGNTTKDLAEVLHNGFNEVLQSQNNVIIK